MTRLRPRRAVAALALLFGAAALPGLPAGAASGLGVDEATEAHEEAERERAASDARLSTAEESRDRLLLSLAAAEAARVGSRGRLNDARDEARALAVSAYIGGRGERDVSILLGAAEATEALYLRTLARDSTVAGREAAREYLRMRRRADRAVTGARAVLDDAEYEVTTARLRVLGAADAEREAAVRLREAEQAAAAPPALVAAGAGGALPVVTGGPSAAQWAALRQCESGGNYSAVNPSGKYRGAYQFDISTWQSVGGSGDPAAAPPAEQDARAKLLYARRGAAPWPVCGQYLS